MSSSDAPEDGRTSAPREAPAADEQRESDAEEVETASKDEETDASRVEREEPGETPDTDRTAQVEPEAFALRGRPERAIRFRREIVVGAAFAALVALVVTAWLALRSGSLELADEPVPDLREATRTPDVLADAPRSYGAVPVLGRPLPGDLGRPILKRQRSADAAAARDAARRAREAAEAERARIAAAARAARESSLFIALGRQGEGTPPERRRSVAQPALPPVHSSAAAFGQAASRSSTINPHRIVPAPSPWTISGGSILSASLVTGIDSDTPGLVLAQLIENAYDSMTGRTVLIPRGARLIGTYDGDVAFGRRRVRVVWQRIIWPNGASLRLDDLPASDGQGHAGLADRVDTHIEELARGVILSTLLNAGTELSLGDEESELVRAVREATQQSGARAGDQLVGRALDIEPTIRIRPGWPLRIIVHRDLVLQPWRP